MTQQVLTWLSPLFSSPVDPPQSPNPQGSTALTFERGFKGKN